MLAVAELPASYSESALSALWSRAHTLADALISEAGERMRVIYPGRPSARAGPDYRDAVLLTEDGRTVQGDIELHTSAPGWYSHGHQTDANYNGVVLHVVFSPKGHAETRQQSGISAPVISLKPVAQDLEDTEYDEAPALPALEALRKATDIASVLDAAGDARFMAKSHGFTLDTMQVGADEALYRGIMDALGYASNREPFRALAERIPYSALAKLIDEPPSTRLFAVKAALLGASGLMQLVDDSEDPALLSRLYKRMPNVRPLKKGDWHLFRVRPSNHPVRRILGAARLIQDSLDVGLTGAMAADISDGGLKPVLSRLERPKQIGRSRARDILVNVLLPFLHAYAESIGDEGLRSTAAEAYAKAPKLQENEITREMRRLCGIEASLKLTARSQQGLIHIYRTSVHRSHI